MEFSIHWKPSDILRFKIYVSFSCIYLQFKIEKKKQEEKNSQNQTTTLS